MYTELATKAHRWHCMTCEGFPLQSSKIKLSLGLRLQLCTYIHLCGLHACTLALGVLSLLL